MKDSILKALSAIIDPDLHKDIVSLGFVKNIRIDGSRISLDIELTTPACPLKASFKKQAEDALMALPEIDSVEINMTARKQAPKNQGNGLAAVQNIIAVASCKGGVGKSTVAAATAVELNRRGFSVGLLDADLFGPSIPTLFGLYRPHITVTSDNMMIPVEHDGLKIMSFGFLLPDGPAIMRGPMVSGYLQQIINQTQWGELDYLIVDMPPGTGDVQLTMTQTVNLSGAVIVTTRQSLSLSDVERGILMFEKVNVPMLGIVENMSWFDCGKCGERHYIFGGNAETGLGERYGLQTLARIPINPELGARPDLLGKSDVLTEMVDNTIRSLGAISLTADQRPEVIFDNEKFICTWPDGSVTETRHYTLRTHCPCAVCVNEYSGEKQLDDATIPPDIQPESFDMLGNYALHIKWNDGHATGIFPFKLIQELSDKKDA